MNRLRVLLLTAYLIIVLVGGVVYVQSVSNMVAFTEADQKFPYSVRIEKMEIPRFVGNQNYSIICVFRFDNPTRATVVLRSFDFVMSVDNGESPSDMFAQERLLLEKVGTAGTSLGDAGPRVEPGRWINQTFVMVVKAVDSQVLDHTNAQGDYVVIIWNLVMAYGFTGTSLQRQTSLSPIVEAVPPG